MKRVSFVIQFVLINAIGLTVRIMPYWVGYYCADTIGKVAYRLLKRRRGIALARLTAAFPDKSVCDIENIARKTFVNSTRNFFELFWVKRMLGDKRIELVGRGLWDRLVEIGTGAVLPTLHLGSWEVMASVPLFGYNVYDVVKPQKNRVIDRMINNLRKNVGLNLIVKGSGAREFIKCLRKERAFLALFCDEYAKDMSVEFFGRQVKAPAGPARLAISCKVPLIFCYTIRDERNHHKIIVDKEIIVSQHGDEEQRVIETMQSIYEEFERVIRRYPEQYFWPWIRHRFDGEVK